MRVKDWCVRLFVFVRGHRHRESYYVVYVLYRILGLGPSRSFLNFEGLIPY